MRVGLGGGEGMWKVGWGKEEEKKLGGRMDEELAWKLS